MLDISLYLVHYDYAIFIKRKVDCELLLSTPILLKLDSPVLYDPMIRLTPKFYCIKV